MRLEHREAGGGFEPPAGEVPGLLMALDHGAVEMSFAASTARERNADTLLTPYFRILIGGPNAADVKVRLGEDGDTCVDNAGANAPYVVVTSVFEGGLYRVQPGQRVMFEHGSLHEGGGPGKGAVRVPSAGKVRGQRVSAGRKRGAGASIASRSQRQSNRRNRPGCHNPGVQEQ